MQTQEKKLGVVSLTALVVGNMMGSGMFLLPSTMARLGSISLFSWIITTIGSLFIAFVFSRMSSLIPKTGGPYAFAQAGLGHLAGFQTAYTYWINAWVGNAAISLAAMGYLSVFFPIFSQPLYASLMAIGFVWLFTAINLCGVHTAGIVQVVTTVLKIVPILCITLFGWMYFQWEYIATSLNVTSSPHLGTFDVITQGVTLTLWSFIGLECATVPASSVKNPKKTIPIATLLGTSLAAVIYILSFTVIMGMIPNDILQNSVSPFADAAQVIFGDWGKWIIAIGAVIGCIGTLNGWILIQGQIPMAAADDHLFLKIFGIRNSKGVPAYGLIITSVLVTLLLLLTISPDLVKQFNVVILIALVATLISYLYTPVAELMLYFKGAFHLSKRSQFAAYAAIIYSFWALWGSGTEVLSYLALLLLSSIPLFLFNNRTHKSSDEVPHI